MTHFKLGAAVFPIITNKQGEILFHRRQNTGYMDGYWDLAGTGHIEAGETASKALIRECREELGIQVDRDGLTLVHLVHRVGASDDYPYLYLYFLVKNYQGRPHIMEPEKNAALAWYHPEELPETIIPDRKRAIDKAFKKEIYDEWEI